MITVIGLTFYIVLLTLAFSGYPTGKPVEERREYKHWGEG